VDLTTKNQLEAHYRHILELLGYDPYDAHFLRTPERVTQAMWEFRKNCDPTELQKILGVDFESEHKSLVQVGPVRVKSFCAHHVLPVTGYAWVGYIPNGKVIGLSKLARVVEFFARQLTVQEQVSQQIVEALEDHLDPKGSMCVIRAWHGCMTIRGVEEDSAATVTSAVRGVFLDDASAKAEFMAVMTPAPNHP
jgi:GTP cyclohydrolase IA